MARYISTFPAGFEDYIAENLPKILGGAEVRAASGALCDYDYPGDARNIHKAGVFTNTFAVLKGWKQELLFGQMVSQTRGQCGGTFPPGAGREAVASFRVRFSQAGQFVGVDSNISRNAEESIARATGLKLDRLGGGTEFWYIRRADGICYFARLLPSPQERAPDKGELRPELAKLICAWAERTPGGVVADLFAGYGSLARQIALDGGFDRLIVNDIDHLMVDTCRQRIGKGDTIAYMREDCRTLRGIESESIDCIVTDPPWGLYKGEKYTVEELYFSVFGELSRVLKRGGEITLLMSQKNDIEALAEEFKFTLMKRNNILVNGKKAVLYKYKKE